MKIDVRFKFLNGNIIYDLELELPDDYIHRFDIKTCRYKYDMPQNDIKFNDVFIVNDISCLNWYAKEGKILSLIRKKLNLDIDRIIYSNETVINNENRFKPVVSIIRRFIVLFDDAADYRKFKIEKLLNDIQS